MKNSEPKVDEQSNLDPRVHAAMETAKKVAKVGMEAQIAAEEKQREKLNAEETQGIQERLNHWESEKTVLTEQREPYLRQEIDRLVSKSIWHAAGGSKYIAGTYAKVAELSAELSHIPNRIACIDAEIVSLKSRLAELESQQGA